MSEQSDLAELEQARVFLRAHLPLPVEDQRRPDLDRAYVKALHQLAAQPDPVDLQLVLGGFNGNLNDSLFEAVGDVLEAMPSEDRAGALAHAMRSGPPTGRAWAASWVGEFPDPSLLEPLAELIASIFDPELRACVVGGVAGIARELEDPGARALLREVLAREPDEDVRIAIEAHLRAAEG